MKKFMYYAPRVLGIVFVIFITMFSLDVFDGTRGLPESVLAFIIHSRFSFILGAILFVSWRNELLGGVLYILLGILFIAINLIPVMFVPPFVIGLLFLLHRKLYPGNKG